MRALLDTSVLISGQVPEDPELAISVVSLAELHFGLLVADEATRAERANRLGTIEARFPDPLALDDVVAREWGRLQAAVARRGGQPRKRLSDLAVAATANVHGASLLTDNVKDLKIIEDLVDIRAVRREIGEHDVVELLDAIDKVEGVGKWPAGTVGAVVSDHGDVKLVEIADERGVMLDLIQVPAPRLKLIAKHSH